MFKFPNCTVVENEKCYCLLALFFQSTTVNFNYPVDNTSVNKYDTVDILNLHYSTS